MPPEAAADPASAHPSSPPDAESLVRLHASCVEHAGGGVLLRGPSGSGKSDLALRLIDAGARLVADDQTLVERRGGLLYGRAPAGLAGLLEVRGLGLVRLPCCSAARLALVVDLDPSSPPARLPEPARCELLGLPLPLLRLDPRPASAAAVVKLALTAERYM